MHTITHSGYQHPMVARLQSRNQCCWFQVCKCFVDGRVCANLVLQTGMCIQVSLHTICIPLLSQASQDPMVARLQSRNQCCWFQVCKCFVDGRVCVNLVLQTGMCIQVSLHTICIPLLSQASQDPMVARLQSRNQCCWFRVCGCFVDGRVCVNLVQQMGMCSPVSLHTTCIPSLTQGTNTQW